MRRIALVTGAGTGIGRGIALALARRGVDLALTGRRAALLADVAREVSALGVRGVPLPADIRSAPERAALIEQVRSTLGPIDILVNNAGVLVGGSLSDLYATEIEQALTLNLTAPIDLIRLALPDLRAQRGAVVLVASVASMVPWPFAPLYTASKMGLRGFGQSLRYELDPLGVRLLIAYPPGTNTPMAQRIQQRSSIGTNSPLFSLLDAEKVGNDIVAALVAGKHELIWRTNELLLIALARFAPSLLRVLFNSQREMLRQAMDSGGLERDS